MKTGFDAMGEPVPDSRKEAAYQQLKDMGVDSFEERFSLVQSVSGKLERDQPFEAQAEAMKVLDLTGACRLMSVLLTS